MRFTVVAGAVLLLGAQPGATALQAQSVRGQLVDSINRAPLNGAFVTLVDAQGAERARAITNQLGQYVLTAPAAGVFRVRSKRIGFRPFVSAPLTLSSGDAATYDAAIDPIPIALQQVVVAGDRQCDMEAGASVAALWEEVREALAAVAWSARSPGFWYDVTNFHRELTPGLRRLGEDSTWRDRGFQPVPFASAPAEALAAQGFVVIAADGWTYHGPDADVLLSEPFLRTHCFETKIGRGETNGLVGLGFSPARGRTLPDVIGTLWVDRGTAELRHLEFHYTRLPERLVESRAGGRIDFMRLPTGTWIVREWRLRMPIARLRQADAYTQPAPEVIAFRESGARTDEIKTAAGALVYRSAHADSAPAVQPAPPSLPPPRSRTRDELLDDEFEGSSATDAFSLVQQYRPVWLQTRGPVSFQNPNAGAILVYVNGLRWGGVNRLRDIVARDVLQMRFLSGPDATQRYGMDHGGGVIEVQTR